MPISGLPPRAGGFLASCSLLNDRALLVSDGPGTTSTVYAIQLSTGRVVLHRDLPPGMVTFAAWSDDGRYAAASSGQLTAAGTPGAAITSDVLDLDDGTVVAHLDGGVAAFSGDDQLVVVSEGANGAAAVVEWRTGREVWKRPASWVLPGDARSLPLAPAMAMTVRRPGAAPDVFLVRSDGTSAQVAQSAVLLTLGSRGGPG